MSINLQKGERISLKKEAPGLKRVMCGLGWDVAKRGLFQAGGADFDLDASVLCLNTDNKLERIANVVYYANLNHESGAIVHMGDNLTGEGEGDDEQIMVDLPTIPNSITKLVFAVNIYEAKARRHDFGQVKNAFIRLVDLANNREIVRYNLSGSEFKGKTGTLVAEVYRQSDAWEMSALGEGLDVSGLQELVGMYS